MPLYEFSQDEVLNNLIEAYPSYTFVFYSGSTYINNFSSSASNLQNGDISLYELNVNRDSSNLVYPFITKDGSQHAFGTVTTSNYNTNFGYGDKISGEYPLTASLHRYYITSGSSAPERSRIKALKNTINYYQKLSPNFQYDNGYDSDRMTLVSIPSIFYGSKINPGSTKLRFYVTGTLVAEAHDKNKNGELIQVTGSSTGNCIGTVLYNEGFIFLTGSTTVATTGDNYDACGSTTENTFTWRRWGEMGMPDGSWGASGCVESDINTIVSSSYELEFEGTTKISTVTMFATAPKSELNYSNNPTFISRGQDMHAYTGSMEYIEQNKLEIKNITSGSYPGYDPPAQKQTFISSIKIYDENYECIAIAKLAKPLKKVEKQGYTFKLKLDI